MVFFVEWDRQWSVLIERIREGKSRLSLFVFALATKQGRRASRETYLWGRTSCVGGRGKGERGKSPPPREISFVVVVGATKVKRVLCFFFLVDGIHFFHFFIFLFSFFSWRSERSSQLAHLFSLEEAKHRIMATRSSRVPGGATAVATATKAAHVSATEATARRRRRPDGGSGSETDEEEEAVFEAAAVRAGAAGAFVRSRVLRSNGNERKRAEKDRKDVAASFGG